MTTRIDKVANASVSSMCEGWPVTTAAHGGSQGGTLCVGKAASDAGAGGNTLPEEHLMRHSVADPPSSPSTTHLTASPGHHPMGSKLALRQRAVAQSGSLVGDPDRDDPAPALRSKTASFYIGGDESMSPPVRTSKKYQSVSESPWKVPGEGAAVLEFTPPDGGYGWVVALAACFINIWIIGFTKSYGVLRVAIREAFPEASAYHISWVPSLLSTVGLLTAPVTGIMCRRFTSRKVSFFGGLLCFLGLLLGCLATSVNHLILSVGLLTGLGSGITTTSGILIVSLYFERRRTFASSICLSGNALGGFFLPPLVDYFLKACGLRGAFLILAALQLHICAASMLFRPISHHAIVQAAELKRKKLTDTAKDTLIPSATISSSARHSSSSHPKVLWRGMTGRYISMENVAESELHHQVSFLRSASMMNTVPNLPLYARSWSVSGGQNSLDNRPSYATDSKPSLTNHSSSKWSLFKIMFAEHHRVSRHSLSDENTWKSTPLYLYQHGGSRRSSLSRVPGSPFDSRSSLAGQTSIRTMHSRIMASFLEQDKEDTKRILQDCCGAQNSVPVVKENEHKAVKEVKSLEKGNEQEEENDEEIEERKSCCGECLRGLCDASLLRDGLLWVMSISVFLMACGTPFYMFYLPSYTESIPISSSVATAMLSTSSIVDLVGRLLTGFVSDYYLCHLHYIYSFSCLAAGAAVLVLPHVTNTVGLTAVLYVIGFFVGSWFVTIPGILAVHHGADNLAASYGIVRLFNGVMNFISPQATGLLYDATKSYQAVYTLMGCSMVCSAAVVLLTPLLVRRRRRDNTAAASPRIQDGKATEPNPETNSV